MTSKAYIIGTGSYLPEKIVANEELARLTGLTPDEIEKMTGILERRRAGEDEATSDMATQAALSALKSAGVSADELGLIVLSTTSQDMFMPSTACLVQKKIGAKKAAAFDINASCSGFLYSMNTAEMFIRSGQTDKALVIAAEVKSRFVNPKDKETAILFGDGAGAVVLSSNNARLNPSPYDNPICLSAKLLGTWLFADGTGWKWIHLPAGGSRIPSTDDTVSSGLHAMRMDGSRVYRKAIRTFESLLTDTAKKCGLNLDDIDHFIFHQANLRIIKQVTSRLGIPEEKVPVTITHTGNTSSASIPITLDKLVREGRIKKGDTVLMAAFGGGLTWGASLITLI
ncbi:MAG: ketoacyl-ACP synthase III [Nitrospirae bacterium]|nr:ketoacyl-ACP synthase III [Nitrospirota bacterium]